MILDPKDKSPPVLLNFTVTVPTPSFTVVLYTVMCGTAEEVPQVLTEVVTKAMCFQEIVTFWNL